MSSIDSVEKNKALRCVPQCLHIILSPQLYFEYFIFFSIREAGMSNTVLQVSMLKEGWNLSGRPFLAIFHRGYVKLEIQVKWKKVRVRKREEITF